MQYVFEKKEFVLNSLLITFTALFMNKLKDIAVLSSLFGALLIFLGIWKLDLFYSHFGIPILDYLDFSEIITSFLDDIWLIIYCILSIILYLVLGSNVLKLLINFGRKRESNLEAIGRKFITDANTSKNIVVSIAIALISWLFFDVYNLKWMIFLTSIFLYQPILFAIKHLTFRDKDLSEDKMINISLVLLLLILIFNISRYEIKSTLKNSKTTVVLQLADTTLKTDSKNCYLGKTAKFVFWFQRDLNKSTIIPLEKVQIITFESNYYLKKK